ncbi:GapS4b family protein [Flavobacterium notoginsengisoli]|uniref:GapS4b family protein n=1 Tax=Flavobacterium notoginsengisoli TaxID=1478199 RepID=UPI00364097B9
MKDKILPYGDRLRQLLVKSNITSSNLNLFLRDKGVFLGGNEKDNSVPLLIKTLITPNEFVELYETQKKKEDNVKINSAVLKCSKDFSLPNIIRGGFDLNELVENSSDYKQNFTIKGSPVFYFEDEVGVLDYEIERVNLLDDWTNNLTTHKGTVYVSKREDGAIELKVEQNSTSKETKFINDLINKEIKKAFVKEDIISSKSDYIRIRFNDFSNPDRIQFLYSFTTKMCVYLDFVSVSDIDIYLDEEEKTPEDLKKFLDELESLKLNGKKLQNHPLVTDSKYHKKVIFASLSLKYKFNIDGVKGECVIKIYFPEYISKKDETSEVQYVINFTINKDCKGIASENELRKKVISYIDSHKLRSYNLFKKKETVIESV